jgi:hypothetical protein
MNFWDGSVRPSAISRGRSRSNETQVWLSCFPGGLTKCVSLLFLVTLKMKLIIFCALSLQVLPPRKSSVLRFYVSCEMRVIPFVPTENALRGTYLRTSTG